MGKICAVYSFHSSLSRGERTEIGSFESLIYEGQGDSQSVALINLTEGR